MSRPIKAALICLPLAGLALPVSADITADDVWSNLDAAIAALGGTSRADLVRSGDTVAVTGHEMLFNLPLGLGEFAVKSDGFTLIETDGTVQIGYPTPYNMQIRGEIYGEGAFVLDVVMEIEDHTTEASGEPGAISYVTSAGRATMAVTDLELETGAEIGEIELDAGITIDGMSSEFRVVEDTLIVIYSRSEIGETTTDFTFSDGAGTYSESRSVAGPAVSIGNMGLIPGGADILNLTAALNDGMYISIESASGASTTETLTRIDGEVVQEQDYAFDGNDATFSFDKSAIEMSGAVSGLLFNALMPPGTRPASIGFDASEIGLSFKMPLLASDMPQDFGIGFNLQDLRLGPSIWALFDPEKVLPRDPATLDVDFGGEMILGADLPDLLALSEMGGAEEVPIQITSVDIARLALSALGMRADSSGQFELDYDNLSALPGVPWPYGSGRAEVEGLNQGLDRLIQLGVIGEEEVFGIRMLIRLGTVSQGDDLLTSEIELTEDGDIIANGQQLR